MRDELPFPVCQIIGYKGAGKTTLMNQLIAHFDREGLHVGALKHHGHGGEPTSIKDADSNRHMASGACISGVQGEKEIHLSLQHKTKLPLAELLDIYRGFQLDLLLMEGYKQAPFPKIVMVRDENDQPLLQESENVIAAATRIGGLETYDTPEIPLYQVDGDLRGIIDAIEEKVF